MCMHSVQTFTTNIHTIRLAFVTYIRSAFPHTAKSMIMILGTCSYYLGGGGSGEVLNNCINVFVAFQT